MKQNAIAARALQEFGYGDTRDRAPVSPTDPCIKRHGMREGIIGMAVIGMAVDNVTDRSKPRKERQHSLTAASFAEAGRPL